MGRGSETQLQVGENINSLTQRFRGDTETMNHMNCQTSVEWSVVVSFIRIVYNQ